VSNPTSDADGASECSWYFSYFVCVDSAQSSGDGAGTGGGTVFVKDVGQVHDGNAVQQNIVRTDGHRSVLLSIIKNGNASTVAVVNGVKQALKIARQAAPSGMQIKGIVRSVGIR
jgi:multidrug efflux pump subunit AcrB